MGKGILAALCVATTNLAACGGHASRDMAATVGPDAGPNPEAGIDFPSVVAGKGLFYWEDRVWQRNANTTLPLPASSYQPTTPTALYLVAFSADTTTLTLTPVSSSDPSYTGALQASSMQRARWDLNAFAGGTFEVWAAGPQLAAELTILGSGVPIVSSSRGELRAPAAH
jgi:hypothetical protein